MDATAKLLTPTAILQYCVDNAATIGIFLVVLYLSIQLFSAPRNLPPGPWGLPIVGYYPFVERDLASTAVAMGKKYKSDIVTLKIFSRRFTMFNTHELIKEHFLKRDHLADRPGDGSGILDMVHPGHEGLLNSSGPLWKEHRRFSLSVLRDFGMGKIAVEEKVKDELLGIFQEMEETGGQPVDPRYLTLSATSNIICNIIFGERFDYKDESFKRYLYAINGIANIGADSNRSEVVFSWMKYIPIRRFQHVHKLQACADTLFEITEEQIAKHKAALQPGHVADYIDAFLLRQQEESENGGSSFTTFQLTCEIFDLFFAGTETTATTLRWAIYYMAKYPGIQECVQREIDSQIGKERLPTMKDKILLPYTEAVLNEIQRMATILPLGVLHANVNQDVEVCGYTIPKNTRVCSNILAVHRDPNVWPDPENFNPDANFLDLANGKLKNQDKLIPFVIGRRSCIGESLAKMELFLFFTGWLQRFSICCPKGATIPDGRRYTLIKQPFDFKVCFVPR